MNEDTDSFTNEILRAEEGKLKYTLHKAFARNATLVINLKTRRKLVDPMLRCEICGFSFIEKYGGIGDGFIEAHHIIPLSALEATTITRENDLILVCSNCHRMLHRGNSVLSPLDLRNKLNK